MSSSLSSVSPLGSAVSSTTPVSGVSSAASVSGSPLFDALVAEQFGTPRRRTRVRPRARRRALTPLEQQIAAEKGGRIAQLIHGLGDEAPRESNRWPFHPVSR
ncbi:hypothetical protein [Frondihabitans cladoniiphilus]|uniref:Uncharacterized protein n=1 Tax=Frondihabitans cladoniiphilus TaxID=715785 RepID=A0ABP8VYR9_9MICO